MRRTFILIGLLGALGGCATSGAEQPRGSAVDRGRFVALRSCAGCHAVGGLSQSPNAAAPSFSLIRQRLDETALRRRLAEISRNGHVEMPPIYMTDDEIRDVAAYIQTIEPAAAPNAGASQVTARAGRAVSA